jgi:hypothetical protein
LLIGTLLEQALEGRVEKGLLWATARDHLEEELAELELRKYCRNALGRRAP